MHGEYRHLMQIKNEIECRLLRNLVCLLKTQQKCA